MHYIFVLITLLNYLQRCLPIVHSNIQPLTPLQNLRFVGIDALLISVGRRRHSQSLILYLLSVSSYSSQFSYALTLACHDYVRQVTCVNSRHGLEESFLIYSQWPHQPFYGVEQVTQDIYTQSSSLSPLFASQRTAEIRLPSFCSKVCTDSQSILINRDAS